jgi:hypothetical protein
MTEDHNNWWELYFTRYLAGNIFAVLVLFYLVSFHGSVLQNRICPDNSDKRQCTTQTEVMVSCAIDPMGKSVCSRSEPKKVCINTVEFKLCEAGKFSDAIFDFAFVTSKDLEFKNNIAATESEMIVKNSSVIKITELNFAGIFLIMVLGFLYMILSAAPLYFFYIIRGFWLPYLILFKNKFDISGFIRTSSSKKDTVLNYDESYSREYIIAYHKIIANSSIYGIIFMEIVFASLLLQFNFSLWLFLPWILSGFCGCFVGMYLECKMLEK